MKVKQLLTDMKKSVSQIIFSYLKEHEGEWHNGYEFVNKSVGVGGQSYFLGSSSDRKARQLALDGKIERRHYKGYAQFRVPKPIPIIAQKKMEFVENMV